MAFVWNSALELREGRSTSELFLVFFRVLVFRKVLGKTQVKKSGTQGFSRTRMVTR